MQPRLVKWCRYQCTLVGVSSEFRERCFTFLLLSCMTIATLSLICFAKSTKRGHELFIGEGGCLHTPLQRHWRAVVSVLVFTERTKEISYFHSIWLVASQCIRNRPAIFITSFTLRGCSIILYQSYSRSMTL